MKLLTTSNTPRSSIFKYNYWFIKFLVFGFYFKTVNLINKRITNPIKPIKPIPIAETFATVINSSRVGFLRTCHILMHFLKKLTILSLILGLSSMI